MSEATTGSQGRVLVLGATSLVGGALLPLLEREGLPTLAISRRGSDADGALMEADLARPQTLASLGPATHVFSLSPIWLLPDALPVLAEIGMTRLVAFSSTSALTKANSSSAAERDIAARLADAEARTLAFCKAHGIGCVILRPTLIYLEGRDSNVSRLAGLIRRFGVLPLAGGGEGLRQPVHAADLAKGALDALRSPDAGGVYDLPGGETLSYRAMVARVFEGLGKPPRIVSIPAPVFQLALGLAGPLLPGRPARWAFGWRKTWCSTQSPRVEPSAGRPATSTRISGRPIHHSSPQPTHCRRGR